MSILRALRPAALVLVLLLAQAPATALAGEPFVNLGFTSFVDGFGDPTGSGFAFVQYFRFARSTSLKDASGNEAPGFVDPRLNAYISVTQVLYSFKKPAHFPLQPGLSLLLPVVWLDSRFGPGGVTLQDNGFGVGDLFIGPWVQLPTIMSGQRPVLFHRFEFDVMAPIGNYGRNIQINQGNHAWSLNPFWAGTVLPAPHLEVSLRFHYLYNFVNNAPVFAAPSLPTVLSTQAGQAIHFNLAASYEVVANTLRVGVSTYFFRQFTESKANGVSIPDSEEQVLGIGPGLVWFPSKVDLLFLNLYAETAVRNRFQSYSAQIRWGRAFESF